MCKRTLVKREHVYLSVAATRIEPYTIHNGRLAKAQVMIVSSFDTKTLPGIDSGTPLACRMWSVGGEIANMHIVC